MAFTNNTHKRITETFIESERQLLKNPYYLFSNQKGTIVDYLNINIKLTTLDDSTKVSNKYFGKDSPIRFNYIKDFYLYGIDKIMIGLDNTENGLSGQDISGDAIILPGTIQPYPNDYFLINYLNKQFLFQITAVDRDTLEDGANFWKASYRLERALTETESQEISYSIAEYYNFYMSNIGTDMKPIIKKSDGDVLEILDEVNSTLQLFYKNLFYSEAVQTFVCPNPYITDRLFYDNMMIEFLIRNSLLYDDGTKYVYIDHKLNLPSTFGIDYASTLYRAFETKDKEGLPRYNRCSVPEIIKEKYTIFATRPNKYFKLNYSTYNTDYINGLISLNDFLDDGVNNGSVVSTVNPVNPVVYILPQEVIDAILSNTLFTEKNKEYNIFIKYFNDIDLNADDIKAIENIPYSIYTFGLFFNLPLLIFCIQYYIKKLLR